MGEDLTKYMNDLDYERQSVMKDCAKVLIRDNNRMGR